VFIRIWDSYGDEVPNAHTQCSASLALSRGQRILFRADGGVRLRRAAPIAGASSFGAWRHDLKRPREKLLGDIVATDLKSRCRRVKRFDKEPNPWGSSGAEFRGLHALR
jgi:hypothetical protein